MIAPRLRIRLPSAPKDGTPSQRQWFAAVTNWINAVVDDTQAPVAETQDKVTRRSLQIDMVDNTPDLEKPLSQAAQARFTAIQESLSRLTASASVTVISDWDVAATSATPTTAKSGMYFRATTAGTVGALSLSMGDVVLFYLDNTGALQWIIVDSPAERSAAYTPADWDATTGVARIENKPTLFGLSSLLTGLGTGSNTAIAAADTLLAALAKLQAQINAGGGGANRYHAPDQLQMDFSTGPTDIYGSVWANPDSCTFSGGALVKGPSQRGIYYEYCPALNFAFEDFTLDFWIKPYSYANPIASVIGSGQASWREGCCVVALSPQGSLRLGSYSYNDIVVSSTGAVVLNVYTHVRFTRASGVFKIFVNGTLSVSVYKNANVTLNGEGTWIGQNGWDANIGYFDGEIKDLRAVKGYAIPDSPFDPNIPAVLPLLF